MTIYIDDFNGMFGGTAHFLLSKVCLSSTIAGPATAQFLEAHIRFKCCVAEGQPRSRDHGHTLYAYDASFMRIFDVILLDEAVISDLSMTTKRQLLVLCLHGWDYAPQECKLNLKLSISQPGNHDSTGPEHLGT